MIWFATSAALGGVDPCFPLTNAIMDGIHAGWITEVVFVEEWSRCVGISANGVSKVPAPPAEERTTSEQALRALVARYDAASTEGLDYAVQPADDGWLVAPIGLDGGPILQTTVSVSAASAPTLKEAEQAVMDALATERTLAIGHSMWTRPPPPNEISATGPAWRVLRDLRRPHVIVPTGNRFLVIPEPGRRPYCMEYSLQIVELPPARPPPPPPPPPEPSPDCVVGLERVELAERAIVQGPINSHGEVRIGPDAQSGRIVSRQGVILHGGAYVEGGLLTGGEIGFDMTSGQSATMVGDMKERMASPPLNDPPTVTPRRPGTEPVSVAAGERRSLAPGRYGSVTVGRGATLVLAAGDYAVTTLTVEEGATLEHPAAATIRARDRFIWRGRQSGPDPLRVEVSGSGESVLASALVGSVIAPAAELRLAGATLYGPGPFAASTLRLGPDTQVICR